MGKTIGISKVNGDIVYGISQKENEDENKDWKYFISALQVGEKYRLGMQWAGRRNLLCGI